MPFYHLIIVAFLIAACADHDVALVDHCNEICLEIIQGVKKPHRKTGSLQGPAEKGPRKILADLNGTDSEKGADKSAVEFQSTASNNQWTRRGITHRSKCSNRYKLRALDMVTRERSIIHASSTQYDVQFSGAIFSGSVLPASFGG
ncbi:hypothetical protein Hypma_014163 [Hypsizygus marmoreus]|uniref:Secreted protein n=1 Tax=Hypsizygus marmoreus TaxID=39966 RepID=A0A369KA52_HYPMA|nr:hypothetical protein Hypma_014163 [Hypsizygus marmoreus]